MARNLESWQHEIIVHMVHSRKKLTTSQMAGIAKCTERSVTHIRKNLQLFGTARAPPVPGGRPPSITPLMLDALRDYLTQKPGLYVEEMAIFLWDEFNVLPSPSSIKRALFQEGWTKKKAQQRTKEPNAQLRGFYHTFFILFIS